MTRNALTARARWLAFAILCLGDIMIVLDSTIVNAPADHRKSLITETAWFGWCLSAGGRGFMLLGGRMADLWAEASLPDWHGCPAASAACGAVTRECCHPLGQCRVGGRWCRPWRCR
jgi:hypothetical protein